jgi:hypothetical protein
MFLRGLFLRGLAVSQGKRAIALKKIKPQYVVLLIICGYYMSKISLTKRDFFLHYNEAARWPRERQKRSKKSKLSGC